MKTSQGIKPEDGSQTEFSDAELEAMANFGASIDDTTMFEIEESAAAGYRQQQRRLTLLALARSADDLSRLSIEDPDTYREMLGSVESFLEHAKGLQAAAEDAVFRLKIADCSEEI